MKCICDSFCKEERIFFKVVSYLLPNNIIKSNETIVNLFTNQMTSQQIFFHFYTVFLQTQEAALL
jgi:hypothetical protein